jgi:hypothetical protein
MKFSSLAVLLSVSAAVNSQVVNDVNKRADGLSPDSGSGAGAGAGAGTGAAAPVPVPAAASVPLPPAAPVGGATTGGVTAVTGAANTPAGAATTPAGAVTGAATGVSEPTRAANTQTPSTAPIGAAPAGLSPLSSPDPAGTAPGTSPISAVSPGEGSSTTVPSAQTKTSSGVFGEPAGAGFHSQSESSLSVLDIETSAAPSLITGAIGPNQATGSIQGSAKPGVAFGDSDSSGSSSSANAAQQGSRAGVGFIMAAVAMGSLLL